MQRFFSVIVIIVIALGGAFYLYNQKAEQEALALTEERLGDARRSFADKARAAVTEDDDQDYLRGAKAALAAYKEELKKVVYKKRPEWNDPGAYVDRVEEQFKKGKIKEGQRKSMLEGYQIVKDSFDTLMAGQWQPILTLKGNGDTRLDIYEMKRIRDPDGNALLEGTFFFWGIEDNTRVSWNQVSLRYWTKRMKKVRRKQEEIEEVLGKAEGDATPRFIIQNPHKYIAQFPSFLSIGKLWLPVMPREAYAVDLSYGYATRKGGTSSDSLLEWPKLPIPPKWQYKEGETWEADVVEATEDEISGKSEEEEP